MKETKITKKMANSKFAKKIIATSGILSSAVIGVIPAYAASSGNAKTLAGDAVGTVVTVMQYVGALLGVWALAQLFLAFKNEDADSKSRAMMTLMASILLVCIKPIASAIARTAGLTIGNGWL